MNEVVNAVETSVYQVERTEALDAVDLGDTMFETKQDGPPVTVDSSFMWGLG